AGGARSTASPSGPGREAPQPRRLHPTDGGGTDFAAQREAGPPPAQTGSGRARRRHRRQDSAGLARPLSQAAVPGVAETRFPRKPFPVTELKILGATYAPSPSTPTPTQME